MTTALPETLRLLGPQSTDPRGGPVTATPTGWDRCPAPCPRQQPWRLPQVDLGSHGGLREMSHALPGSGGACAQPRLGDRGLRRDDRAGRRQDPGQFLAGTAPVTPPRPRSRSGGASAPRGCVVLGAGGPRPHTALGITAFLVRVVRGPGVLPGTPSWSFRQEVPLPGAQLLAPEGG